LNKCGLVFSIPIPAVKYAIIEISTENISTILAFYPLERIMTKRFLILTLLVAILILSACDNSSQITPTPVEVFPANPIPTLSPTPPPLAEPTILISEVLTGVDGNNNNEFIELYNTGSQDPIDLRGWSLWFKLADDQAESLVYRWDEHALVPPEGHYLLVREGQDVGITADVPFSVPMIPRRGSLQLRLADGAVVDSLSWGSGAADYAEGNPADTMKNGLALERTPGGSKGNWIDTDNNAVDFVFSSPSPQNTGSLPTPGKDNRLVLSVNAPETVIPGNHFDYIISVTNETGKAIRDVTVQFPISLDLEVIQIPTDVEILDQAKFWDLEDIGESNQVTLWSIDSLGQGETVSTNITVRAPWTYTEILAANYSAQAGEWPEPTFGSPIRTAVEGGAIPISALRDLAGENLVIEGTATMYTGGYYAGTGNVKFYLEDDTGGVQVWVPGGEGTVDIAIGSLVRVFGNLQVYRGALEMVVNDLADVELLASSGDNQTMSPTTASIAEAAIDPSLAGKLLQVSGMVARNEEFTYSYELDLIDETGQLITLYVDKQTNINVETIEDGQFYRATGILEIYDTLQQLYPRFQTDFERIYPPVLVLEMKAPVTIDTGEELRVTLTATNHTPGLLTDVVITATMPRRGGVQFVAMSEGGEVKASNIIWTIPELAGNGASVSVNYVVLVNAQDEYITFKNYAIKANEWPETVVGNPYLVFLGDTVPIWAIQGAGYRSPYVFQLVTVTGTVTGIFPELEGFWIQEFNTDKDPLTSSGLFIHSGEVDIPVAVGDSVQVSGIVRESYQQTQVQVSIPEDIVILETGGPLPASVELDPPADESESNSYYESLEGMLVQVSEAGLAVGPTSAYGEYVLVLAKNGVNRLWQGDTAHNGLAIMVDDGSSVVHEDRSALPYVINTGDRVANLIGPLAYTYGRYKVEPIVQPQVFPQETDLPVLESIGPEAFSIMTWNVENLFDAFDPHPSSPAKPSILAYKVSIAKVANTILAAGVPTIVGLQEVENIDILEDIARHEALAGFDYQFFLIEGTDSRYIDNGYLVRGDIARVLDVQQLVAPGGLTSRPPLRIEVEIRTNSTPVRVYVLNNHFTSMSGGEQATEPRRNAQAAWNVTSLEDILGADPEAHVAILGDLNSYYESLPLDTLRDAGLVHVFEVDPAGGWYSYIYQGASQTIDHILVTPNLFDLIQRVDVLHVDSDFAPPETGDESPLGKSDHDPIIVTFSIPE
jgi:DNA/RNA endonuclease YhcR with UshA esterase domain